MEYPSRLILHLIGVTVFGVAYVGVALPKVVPAVRNESVQRPTIFQSSDTYLFACTEIVDGSQMLLNLFRALPKHKPIGVRMQETNAESRALKMLVAYFAWPREVRIISWETKEPIDPRSFSAVFFCHVVPPAGAGPGVRLGSHLVFVPISPAVAPNAP